MQLWCGDQALPPRWTCSHRARRTSSSASSRACSKCRIGCLVLACSMVDSVSTPMRWSCRRDGISGQNTRVNSSSTRSPKVWSRAPWNGSECAARLWHRLSDLSTLRRRRNKMNRREALNLSAITALGLAIPGSTLEARAQGALSRTAAWPNKRLLDLLKIEHPIVQAPMGGHVGPDMPPAVSGAGGLGSFPCTGLTPAQVRDAVGKIRTQTSKPLNINFFCHAMPRRDEAVESAWRRRLAPYYAELGVDPPASPTRILEPFGS